MDDLTPPLLYVRADLPPTLAARLAECQSGCWEWQEARNEQGYGRPHWEGRQIYAHRLVYTILVGLVASGLVLDHLCRNPPCCNPVHLEPVTAAENARRARVAVRLGLLPVVPETPGGRPMLKVSADGELWLPVPVTGYEDLYEVSDWGRVRSLHDYGRGLRGAILKQYLTKDGRATVTMWNDNVKATKYVHQLVARAFIGPQAPGQEVRHLNDVASDNHLANLEYGSSSDNKIDQVLNGRHYEASKTHCDNGHEFTVRNTRWRKDRPGTRDCRACFAQASVRRREFIREHGLPCPTPGCAGRQIALGLCMPCYVRKRAAERRGPGWEHRVCPHCERSFERAVALGQGKRKYCSDDCAREAKLIANRDRMRAKRATANN